MYACVRVTQCGSMRVSVREGQGQHAWAATDTDLLLVDMVEFPPFPKICNAAESTLSGPVVLFGVFPIVATAIKEVHERLFVQKVWVVVNAY